MKRLFPILALAAACGSVETSTPDPDAGTPTSDAGTPDDSGNGSPEAGPVQGDAGRPPAVPADPSTYADLIAIDAAFPFVVTQVHAADDKIGGAHWGRHYGPMVTTNVYGNTQNAPAAVEQWSFGDQPVSAATRIEKAITPASGLPAQFFYGADGMIDMDVGNLSLLDYTSSGAAFPGEALLYNALFDTVVSRANVNGFYSGAGIPFATPVIVYSGLSGMSKTASATNDNGFWGAPICNDSAGAAELGSANTGCDSWKLFGWTGNSGPVVLDLHRNAFVAASITSPSAVDTIYAVSRDQIVHGQTVTPAGLTEQTTGGTGSIAAITPDGSNAGWVLGLGFDPSAGVYANDYTDGATITKGTHSIAKAITPATGVDSLTVFTDVEGDLWLAVTKSAGTGAFVELRRKP